MREQEAEPISNEQAVKRTELIALWARIDGFLQLTQGTLQPESQVIPDEVQAAARARFAALFAEEIQVVSAAWNSVAHARPIDDTVLDAALELARELVRIIHEGQGIIASPPAVSSAG